MTLTPRMLPFTMILLALAGCASTPVGQDDLLRGTWCFVYAENAPAPPRFDKVSFAAGEHVELTSSLHEMDFMGSYAFTGRELTWRFDPPELDEPVVHSMDCAFQEGATAMKLTLEGMEFVYFRTERLLTDDLAGTWLSGDGTEEETMRLNDDGTMLLGGVIIGRYRLWTSRFGPTMTAIIGIPGEGDFTIIWIFTRDGDTLTLTPILGDGPSAEHTETFALATEQNNG